MPVKVQPDWLVSKPSPQGNGTPPVMAEVWFEPMPVSLLL